MAGLRKELRQRKFHRPSDLRKGVERRDSVAVLHSRQVAAQQACALFYVALGHTFPQPVISDRLTDVHRENGQVWFSEMVNSNQSSTVWQVEILLHNERCRRTRAAPRPALCIQRRRDFGED